MDMCARRLTGRNVINGTCMSLVQVDRFHADRKNVMCFSLGAFWDITIHVRCLMKYR